MQRKFWLGLVVLGLLACTSLSHAQETAPAPDGATALVSDTAHSNVGFAVPIAGGLAKVRGKFSRFTVNLNYHAKDITKSTVTATIKADSIDTGIEGRDNHLKTPDFFEVAKYPDITFTSKKVLRKGKQLSVTGDFTMHGVTQEITIPFTLSGDPAKLKAGEPPVGVQGSIKIDRRTYGITYARKDDANFIGNEIEIELSLLMVKPRPPRP
jgi:polyisoprenoid-binding protein YceI